MPNMMMSEMIMPTQMQKKKMPAWAKNMPRKELMTPRKAAAVAKMKGKQGDMATLALAMMRGNK